MQVSVVGAGFSGLATAYYLRRLGVQVRVFEKSARAGGLLSTTRHDWGLVESAANGIRASKKLEELAKEINLRLVPASRKNRKRYIFRGMPRQMPLSGLEFFKFISGVMRRRPPLPGVTLQEWARAQFGQGALDYLVEPAVLGVFASEAENLSATLVYNYFFRNRPAKPATISRGTVAPLGGMGELIDRLVDHLERAGVEFSFNTEIESIRTLYADRDAPVVLATDATAAARILLKEDSWVSEQLESIQYLPLISATLSWDRPGRVLTGFGCLFPRKEKFHSFGVLFNTDIFPERGSGRSETWIMNPRLSLDHMTDGEVIDLILEDRRRFISETVRPDHCEIHRWTRALPSYDLNLERVLHSLVLPPHVHLVGNYLGGLGLAKILEQASVKAKLIVDGRVEAYGA